MPQLVKDPPPSKGRQITLRINLLGINFKALKPFKVLHIVAIPLYRGVLLTTLLNNKRLCGLQLRER